MNAVVIGATQGLGLCLVRELLSGGHKVSAGIIDRAIPPALLELTDKYSEKLMIFQADVTNEEEIIKGATLCKEFLGEIDSLCNVAGVILKGDRDNKITECDISDLRKTFDVNAFGPVIVCKSFNKLMKKGSHILTVTSEGCTDVMGCGTWVPCYGMSKIVATRVAGMFNATVTDVDFYAVHPGRMNTEMGKTTAQIEPEESASGFYKLMTGVTPISRKNWYIDYNGKIMDA